MLGSAYGRLGKGEEREGVRGGRREGGGGRDYYKSMETLFH